MAETIINSNQLRASGDTSTQTLIGANQIRQSGDSSSQTLLNKNQIAGGDAEILYLTKNGSPTINNGEVYGFSFSNYLIFNNFNPSKHYSFKMKFQYFGNTANRENNCLIGWVDGGGIIAIAVNRSNKLYMGLSTDSSSWNISNLLGSSDIQTDTDYYIKFSFDGAQYKLELSTDDISYTTECVVSSTALIRNGQELNLTFGKGHSLNDWHFNGKIYLNKSGCVIDGIDYVFEVTE